MKQILRLGEGYGRSNIKRYILYALLISIGVAWLQDNTARAQQSKKDSTKSIQDTVFELDEVEVSTGYQTLPKERSTGSFVQIDSALFNRRVSSNLLDRLEGIVPGLLFNRNTAASRDGGLDLSIRGTNSIEADRSPLVVVDNFPYDGPLSHINPNDISGISILKDAAAASIWGVRAGNGVIVIRTKQGSKGMKPEIGWNLNATSTAAPDLYYDPNYLASPAFIGLEQELFDRGFYDNDLENGISVVSPAVALLAANRAGETTDADVLEQLASLKSVDIRDELERYFYRPAFTQQYTLYMRGGHEAMDYYVSLGYDDNRADKVGEGHHRITLNSTLNFRPAKKLELSLAWNYAQTKQQQNSPLPDIHSGELKVNRIYPYARLADASGQALTIVKDYPASYIAGNTGGMLYDWGYRPLDELKYADNSSLDKDLRLSISSRYRFGGGFSAEGRYQYQSAGASGSNYYSDSTYFTRNTINRYTQEDGGFYTYPVPAGGILYQDHGLITAHRGRLQANYSADWDNRHSVQAIAGAELNAVVSEGRSSALYGFDKQIGNFGDVDYQTSFALHPSGASARIPSNLSFGKRTDHYVSFFTNWAYTHAAKYTVTASARIDRSNLFGVRANQKAVPLYSAGLAWELSKETFYRVSLMPKARLRFSYGYNGNVDKSATAVMTLIQSNYGSWYNSLPYSSIKNPGNPELRWERTRIINWGLDFGFKPAFLSGSVDYFIKKGVDLFGSSPLPGSSGLTSFRGNTASTAGRGLDVVLNSVNIRKRVFSWSTSFQLSYVLDKVSKYDLEYSVNNFFNSTVSNTIYPLTGRPLYAIYAYRWGGLNPATGDPQGYIGDEKSTDYNAIISATSTDNIPYIGPARPTTFGSLRHDFTYGSLSLSFNVLFKLNYYFRRSSVNYPALYTNWVAHRDFERRWKQPGDEAFTQVPSIEYPPVSSARQQFYMYSAALVENGDHIRLQDISLSYLLKPVKLGKAVLMNCRIYGYVNQVALLWKATDEALDPDTYMNGSGEAAFPLSRTFSLGINANF